MFSKGRRSSSGSYPVQMNAAADRTVTIALPTSNHPNLSPTQAAEMAALQYQQELLADFFSGSAAPRPRPPPPASSSDHSSAHSPSKASTYDTMGKKSKWGGVLLERDAKAAAAKANVNVYPEPTTLSKRMFQFGFGRASNSKASR